MEPSPVRERLEGALVVHRQHRPGQLLRPHGYLRLRLHRVPAAARSKKLSVRVPACASVRPILSAPYVLSSPHVRSTISRSACTVHGGASVGAPFRHLAAVAFTTALAAPCHFHYALRSGRPLVTCTETADQQDSPGLAPGRQAVQSQAQVSRRTRPDDNTISIQTVSAAAVGCLLSPVDRFGRTAHSNIGCTSTPHVTGIPRRAPVQAVVSHGISSADAEPGHAPSDRRLRYPLDRYPACLTPAGGGDPIDARTMAEALVPREGTV